MASGKNIKTYFNGEWKDENTATIKAADHGAWLGTSVFDGARYFDGVAPDLWEHCNRVNNSARAMMITPTVSAEEMVDIVWEGLRKYKNSSIVSFGIRRVSSKALC